MSHRTYLEVWIVLYRESVGVLFLVISRNTYVFSLGLSQRGSAVHIVGP